MKEIKDGINRWRDTPCSWVGRTILWKWLYYQIQYTDSMWSLSNYQWHFFDRSKTKRFTIHMETQKTPNSQSSPKKGERSYRNQLSWLQIILQIIKTVWFWHKNRNIEKWNKIEISEISPYTYGSLIFDRTGKNI